jgi:hypothetical protein
VLETSRQIEVRESVEKVIADLSDHVDAAENADGDDVHQLSGPADAAESRGDERGVILCVAARTPLDQAASAILLQLLERRRIATRFAGPQANTTAGVSALDVSGVRAICLVYLDHHRPAAVRYSVRRLRKKFIDVPIAVCLWVGPDLAEMRDAAEADATIGSLGEAIEFCARTAVAKRKVDGAEPVRIRLPEVS